MTEVSSLHANLHWEPDANGVELINEDEWESGNSTSKLYERSRIKALAEEREVVQKKTFQKWVNSHLIKVNTSIDDLYSDLRDGRALLKLLELLSGEKLPKPTRGKMRIHCLENVDKSLNFLIDQRVHLENMGAHDIVDGNQRLTLGLIWTIILRFQIQDITMDEVDSISETRQAKDALLLWCQMKTAGYPNVNVRNFTSSWRDGLAFNALIHKHRPDLIDFNKLNKARPLENLEEAFNVAQDKLGLPRFFDPEDVNVEHPDERSIMTYVASYYHYFSKMKADNVHSRRIDKVLLHAIESDELVDQYEALTSDLLEWIRQTIELLNDRTFANNLNGVQQQLAAFNTYSAQDNALSDPEFRNNDVYSRTNGGNAEKPPKFAEKGNLEVLLFTVQHKLRANNQRPYTPKESLMVSDINRAWEDLEKAEHARELALRDELIRQEKLEQLASRFYRKAEMREVWLSQSLELVAKEFFGNDLPAVEAATKRHEAMETDVMAYEERVNAVVHVASELAREEYHDIDRVDERKNGVLQLWQELLDRLARRRKRLELALQMQKVFQEMLYLLDWIEEIKSRLKSEDFGKHLMGVDDLLEKHQLLEADVRVLGERMDHVLSSAQRFVDCDFDEDVGDYRPADPPVVEKHGQGLREAYEALRQLANERFTKLEESQQMWQFLWDMSEEEQWIKEMSQLMSSPDLGHDLPSVHRLLNKHRAHEEEMKTRREMLQASIDRGEALIEKGNMGSDSIKKRIEEMNESWENLVDLASERKRRLLQSLEFYQCLAECDETDAWMTEMSRIVSNEDVGSNQDTVQSLLKKHNDVTNELKEYRSVINSLHDQANNLAESDIDATPVENRLTVIDERYQKLLELADVRQERLLDALSMYRLFAEADNVHTWITEKRKLLCTLSVDDEEIEELEVIRHRFGVVEGEMQNFANKMSTVNELAQQLVRVEHPDSEQILNRQDSLNNEWNQLAGVVDGRRDELSNAFNYNQFLIECRETSNWIQDKMKLIESTDELGNDLDGIMQLQRRLGGLQRDMAAIEAKVGHLDEQADQLVEKRGDEVEPVVHSEQGKVDNLWEQLKEMLKDRDERLNESSELQRFLQNLDHFQVWLSKTQTTIASEDIPKDLTEAEKLKNQHEQLKDEINGYEPEFHDLMNYGQKVTEGQTDAQYMFLRQRLDSLETGWNDLHQMWENRQSLLSQSLSLQIFQRDAVQVDVQLNQQENFLSKEDVPSNLEAAENMIKQHENFMATMNANEEKINSVLTSGEKLLGEDHYASEKIRQKCEQIAARREANRKRSEERYEQLRDHMLMQQLMQDSDDLEEWMQEKMIVATDDSYRDAKNIASRYNRHKAFEREIDANKDRLQHVIEDGGKLVEERPLLAEQVQPRLSELQRQWDELNQVTHDKGENMLEANRETIFNQGSQDVMTFLSSLEEQMVVSEEEVVTLTEVNVKMKNQDEKDREIEIKRKQIDDLQAHAHKLKEQHPDRAEEIEETRMVIEQRFQQLQMPVQERKQGLARKKRIYQFLRDVDDEIVWAEEKLVLAHSLNVGSSLLSVHQLLRRQRFLRTEVENHKPQKETIVQEGRQLIEEGYPEKEKFETALDKLDNTWDQLENAIEDRQKRLEGNEVAQQYLSDASESEAWMGEQELYLISEPERVAKDEQGANNAMKKHEQLEKSVEHYADEIRSLGDRCRQLLEAEHPESDAIAVKQARVDKMYAGLRDLCSERRSRLEEKLKLFALEREILDLEAWLAERTVVASSHETGSDYEHCCLLRDRFREFTRETEAVGGERVNAANELCDSLIEQGHSEAAVIAAWKDRINEAWADLLELIETRTQLLKAAWDLHKFYSDCQDTLDRIEEKKMTMSSIETLGKDAKSVATLQRKHTTFEHDLTMLAQQVHQVQESAATLLPSYSNDQERQIKDRRDEVLQAWADLRFSAEQRRSLLMDASDFHRFLAMIRELRLWMSDMRAEIQPPSGGDRPRDVSGVELLMNSHRGSRAEIDAREENFAVCINLGRTLLSRKHLRRLDEVREALIVLITERIQLNDLWDERQEQLQLMLEVYQFARDAAVAEAWVLSHETYLVNQDLGESLGETLALLKKHEDFEKAAATQEDRFSALQKLTTFEIKESQRTPEAEEAKRREKEARIHAATKEFKPPPTPPVQRTPVPEEKAVTPISESQAESSPSKPPRYLPRSSDEGEGVRRRPSLQEKGTPQEEPNDWRLKGLLQRKHEWENGHKKASSRAWHSLYMVLEDGQLSAFKDERHYKTIERERPNEMFHHESGLDLAGASAGPANDYGKRPNVFRLKLVNGGEYLFQSNTADEMNKWCQYINRNTSISRTGTPRASISGGVPVQRSATMPASSRPEQLAAGPSQSGGTPTTTAAAGGKEKKKFFTLGRSSKK